MDIKTAAKFVGMALATFVVGAYALKGVKWLLGKNTATAGAISYLP